MPKKLSKKKPVKKPKKFVADPRAIPLISPEERELLKARIMCGVEKQKGNQKDMCWIWQRMTVGNPKFSTYPAFQIGGVRYQVRRVVYELWGLEPFLGVGTVRAVCGSSLCCNPKHLYRHSQPKGGLVIKQ